jgi:hypothetical protein
VRGVLREREKNEFDLALRTVSDSLDMVEKLESEDKDKELADFYQQRMQSIQQFFNSLDNLVGTLIALDNLRLGAVQNLFGKQDNKS